MKFRDSSRFRGFFELSVAERLETLKTRTGVDLGAQPGQLTLEQADLMVENAVGMVGMPLGVATNFIVNGADVIVPMAVEEPSVIAAASNAAKMVRAGSGFTATAQPPLTTLQIEIRNPVPGAKERICAARAQIIEMADRTQPELVSLGGGARELIVRETVGDPSRMVVHLIVDCRDAMGANSVNTMGEAISERLAELGGGRAGLRILTNLADRRLARATCEVPFYALERPGFAGEAVAHGIAQASDFAIADPYRACTHNKGVFNGIDALLVATGNDWRAVEAGGHAHAARSGSYGPLATWEVREETLLGEIELPMAVGIVGGASKAHPTARRCIELLGVETGTELAEVAASVGLASNLAALAALASEGIQGGHMRLHERRLRQKADR